MRDGVEAMLVSRLSDVVVQNVWDVCGTNEPLGIVWK